MQDGFSKANDWEPPEMGSPPTIIVVEIPFRVSCQSTVFELTVSNEFEYGGRKVPLSLPLVVLVVVLLLGARAPRGAFATFE